LHAVARVQPRAAQAEAEDHPTLEALANSRAVVRAEQVGRAIRPRVIW